MVVNGLKLPDAFVQFLEEHGYSDWELKGNVDAYGHPLEEATFVPYNSVEWMEQETAPLAQYFGPADLAGYSPEVQAKVRAELAVVPPGFLPEIADFSQIVRFGTSPSGEPYCFDFRENSQEPSIIHFPDVGSRWRRIAPNFETFISMFEDRAEDEKKM